MNLLDVTSYEEVRALLGVSEEELEDQTLALPNWSTELTLKLGEISALVEPTYVAIAATAEAGRTADQKKFHLITRLYGAYVVAEELLNSLPLFAYKRVSDGKAEQDRIDFFDDVKTGVKTGAANMRLRLKQILAQLDSGYTLVNRGLPGLTAAAVSGFDPVTGA